MSQVMYGKDADSLTLTANGSHTQYLQVPSSAVLPAPSCASNSRIKLSRSLSLSHEPFLFPIEPFSPPPPLPLPSRVTDTTTRFFCQHCRLAVSGSSTVLAAKAAVVAALVKAWGAPKATVAVGPVSNHSSLLLRPCMTQSVHPSLAIGGLRAQTSAPWSLSLTDLRSTGQRLTLMTR